MARRLPNMAQWRATLMAASRVSPPSHRRVSSHRATSLTPCRSASHRVSSSLQPSCRDDLPARSRLPHRCLCPEPRELASPTAADRLRCAAPRTSSSGAVRLTPSPTRAPH
eukprot:1239037-Prymnesium_polylepis.1